MEHVCRRKRKAARPLSRLRVKMFGRFEKSSWKEKRLFLEGRYVIRWGQIEEFETSGSGSWTVQIAKLGCKGAVGGRRASKEGKCSRESDLTLCFAIGLRVP